MSVLRNVGLLAAASAASQALSFVAAPVLARLFAPGEFGVLGVFLAFAGVLGVAACLRLDLAVVVPRDHDEAADVLVVALLANAVVVGASALVVSVAGGAIARALGEPAVATLLPYLPAYLGVLGTFQALNYWSTRNDRFGRVAGANVARAATTAGAQAALGTAGLGAFGLLIGQVAGQAAALAWLLVDVARRRTASIWRRRSWRSVARVVATYREFVVFGAPQAVVNAINQGLPAVVLTVTFDAQVAGFYLMAHRLVTAPVGLVGRSVRQVLYPRLGRAQAEGNAFAIARRATIMLAATAVVPVVVAVVFAPAAFAWLLGAPWRPAGEFARYLVVWLAVGFVNIPSVSLVPLLHMQRWHAAYEVVYLLCRTAALVAGARTGDPLTAIALFAAVGVAFNAVLVTVPLLRARSAQRAATTAPTP